MSRSQEEQYDEPDDAFDPEYPGTFEEGMATQRKLLDAKLAAQRVLPRLYDRPNDQLRRQMEKAARMTSIVLPPETLEKVNETINSQVGKMVFSPETMRKMEAWGPKLDPALSRKYAQAARDIEKVKPFATPFRYGRTAIRTPILELEALPAPPERALPWWQKPQWAFAATLVTIIGFPILVASFLIEVF